MGQDPYEIELSVHAAAYLSNLQDKAALPAIVRKIDDLAISPASRGKPLTGELKGYRSIPTAGRYRILFQVREDENRVVVVCIGIRREGSKDDVYNVANKLLG